MARPKVKLNHVGIAAILQSSGVHQLVQEATESIAGKVQAVAVEGVPGAVNIPVETNMTTTDRAHGTVTLAHPAGQAVQAKHGSLTKAAASAGLEVHEGLIDYVTKSGKTRKASRAQVDNWTRGR